MPRCKTKFVDSRDVFFNDGSLQFFDASIIQDTVNWKISLFSWNCFANTTLILGKSSHDVEVIEKLHFGQ